MKVYVKSQSGKWLMPTNPANARILLKKGKARVIQRTPFAIQLLYETTEYVQPVTVGIDDGGIHVGIAAVSQGNIKEVYLEPLGVSPRSVALRLKVFPSTFARILKGQSSIRPAMAFRLSKWLGRTPESRLHIQNSYDLWHAKQKIDLSEIEPLEVPRKWRGSRRFECFTVRVCHDDRSERKDASKLGTRKKKTRWTCKSLVTCCLKKSQSGT